MTTTTPKPRLLTVKDWPHPWPSTGTLRRLIFHADSNGFSEVVCRIGGRVLIDEDAFFRWVEKHRGLPRAGKREARRSERSAAGVQQAPGVQQGR